MYALIYENVLMGLCMFGCVMCIYICLVRVFMSMYVLVFKLTCKFRKGINIYVDFYLFIYSKIKLLSH